jgi:molybdenum cofactor synthesis domain-containing protein
VQDRPPPLGARASPGPAPGAGAPGSETPKTAAALVIGNELLSGKVEEANVAVLARTLRALGIALRRAVTITDEIEEIAREVRDLSRAHDWLFTSGGVGPTHDDVTIEAVAMAFGVPVVTSPEMERCCATTTGIASPRATCEWRSSPRGRHSRRPTR